MTTTKPVVDSLTMQGKGMPENSVPPQTIIMPVVPTETQFANSLITVGSIIPNKVDEVLNHGQAPLVDGGKERIAMKTLEVAGIIPPDVDEFTIGPMSDATRQRLVEAESRRQSVQAESMVNLAVGFVLARQGQTSIGISKQDLVDFQQNYTVNQQIGEDGGFIITVTPKV